MFTIFLPGLYVAINIYYLTAFPSQSVNQGLDKQYDKLRYLKELLCAVLKLEINNCIKY